MIAEGDLVFLEDRVGKRSWARVSGGMVQVPGLGVLDCGRLLGLVDGAKVQIAGRDFNVFKPGIVDLMTSLDRGAQIISPKDAATILLNCNVTSGSKVLEVGAGSGGLTTALLSAVAPSGKVHTVEFKDENVQRALRNVSKTGLDAYWESTSGDARDVQFDFIADSLIMDMPDPWLALDNLLPHLRSGGRICSYVPNANQLEAIVNSLRERGFSSVFALENIQRGMEVHAGGVRPSFDNLGHTGYLAFGRKASR